MAMFKEADITANLIQTKFPKVASAIIASAAEEQPEITADLIRDQYPDIAAVFTKEGEEKGRSKGAEAEAQRLAEIDAVAMAGYEDIVAEAKKDSSKTANDVKLSIFDAMSEKSAGAASARAEDGANLAAQVAELNKGAGAGDEQTDEDKAVALMDAAAKKAKGA
ncbi:hypothetical protein [Sulfurovum sp.]|uniref:hypothetical protein n=1 Tax=Sulfurovum sp. TaxID=1969726 RepID=UPI0026213789|nr:hypothetical protein [Sulfurovum sp.]